MFKRKGFNRKLKEGLKARRFHRINESASEEGPRVYVGTYGLYNEGSLEGDWFNLFDFDSKEDFYEALEKRFEGIDDDPEFMFQDNENCGGLVSESSIDDELFDLIQSYFEDDHGLDWDSYIELASDYDLNKILLVVPDYFDDDSKIGEQYIDTAYRSLSELDRDTLERYFDYEAYGRDIRLENPHKEVDGNLYLFSR